MGIKLSRRLYHLILSILWGLLIFRSISIFTSVTEYSVFIDLILVGCIFQISVYPFIKNIYKFGFPKIIDFFRFSSFIFLPLNYLNIADQLNEERVGIYGILLINKDFVTESLFCVFICLLAIGIADKMFSLKFHEKNNVTFPVVKNVVLKNLNVFISISFFFISIQFYLLFAGLIGYGADSTYYAENQYSFVLQFLSSFSGLFFITYAILKYLYDFDTRKFNFYYILYCVLYFVFGLYSGMKGTIIFGIVYILLPFYFSGRSLKKSWIVSILVVGFLLYPINTEYREILAHNENISKDVALGLAINSAFQIKDFGEKSSSSYNERLSMFPYLVKSLELENKWDVYKNMERYFYLPISFIPRFLLSNKPTSDTGSKFQNLIFQDTNNSITPTAYGWAYLEGGLIYAFLQFFLLGIVISIFQYVVNKKTIFFLIFYSTLIVQMLVVENDVYFLLAQILQSVFIYSIYYKIFFKKIENGNNM
ncbi:oligosaccharide repeat unit polymerase [Flavobacterium cellulosilyticum]|uniref:Oligosaccharide repeat unit polymerase n=1 Tax=Flavobacterium cellulosilyticum TaxID=2541731 RepID=A0A4R5CE74_9FLAO|nr:oligosaccharide repeat unit polymerase [Flavobacterium cellulosilyticum]TDD98358.1 oligosaccharide repeat unit polymerase [Flavobacterium cellulosilyticum]